MTIDTGLAVRDSEAPAEGALIRIRLAVDGVVQGVGFRTFVWRLAQALGLDGCTRNTDPRARCARGRATTPHLLSHRAGT